MTGLKTVIYPVQDLGQAKALYSGLLGGVEPVMDQAYYVQFTIDGTEVGLDRTASRHDRPVSYWHVDDIKQTIADPAADAGSRR